MARARAWVLVMRQHYGAQATSPPKSSLASADDCVTKPFSIHELMGRIEAAIRRTTTSLLEIPSAILIDDIELDPARRLVRKAHQVIRLTPKEFDLLYYLMAHSGLPITHAKLLRAVWGAEYGGELEYLPTFVRGLRKKLEDDPASPQYILAGPYIGYHFKEPENGGQAR